MGHAVTAPPLPTTCVMCAWCWGAGKIAEPLDGTGWLAFVVCGRCDGTGREPVNLDEKGS